MVNSGLDSEWCRVLKSFLQGFAMPGLSTGQVEAQRRPVRPLGPKVSTGIMDILI
jgi:hypothetical protein